MKSTYSRPDAEAEAQIRAAREDLRTAENLLASGQAAQALPLARRCLGLDETHAPALALACRIHAALGDMEQALDCSGRVARMAPDLTAALMLHASCLHAARDHAACRDQCLKVLAREPDNREALRFLLSCGLSLGTAVSLTGEAVRLASLSDSVEDWALALRTLAEASGGRAFGLAVLQGGHLCGAALDPRRPQDQLGVAFSVGGTPAGVMPAGLTHPAFALASLPDGHAFRMPLPAAWAGAEVTATLADSGLACHGSPLKPAGAGAAQGRAAVEAVSRIVGHLWHPTEPGSRRTVRLADDAGQVREVLADRFRPELLERGLHDGAHGFEVVWEVAAQGGCCARVSVSDAATGAPLPGSPVTVCDPGRTIAALAAYNGWLRQAGLSPDAPPPLPPQCRGEFLRAVRERGALWLAELETQTAEALRKAAEAQEDGHAPRG
ncbi:tetratricopeptide repeat protein [Fundidesulfovibrio agrisoli]|uniref:tetratricopeptide repeat protein n=1 Tax=Fundidesulfovibrio agrisoli TaxID=2922717 RepID=UPI001FAE042A|nr:tetratricopeptide repeat protein [Fundidesulfovibrio agrisoli]